MTVHPAISARGELHADQAHRRVPRDDRPGDADGFLHDQPDPAAGRLGRLLPGKRASQAGVIVERRRGTGRRPAGDDLQHARLARPYLADIVRTRPDLGRDRPQILRPLRVGQPWPGTDVKRLPGRADRSGDIGGLRLSDPEVQLLARRVDHVDHGTRGGRHPLPADEEPVRMPDRCLEANLVRQAHQILPDRSRALRATLVVTM
jgi:hypothetical protein